MELRIGNFCDLAVNIFQEVESIKLGSRTRSFNWGSQFAFIALEARDFYPSAESIPTHKNGELIHFDLLLRGFVGKEMIHDI